jgi:hypothetical protein
MRAAIKLKVNKRVATAKRNGKSSVLTSENEPTLSAVDNISRVTTDTASNARNRLAVHVNDDSRDVCLRDAVSWKLCAQRGTNQKAYSHWFHLSTEHSY